MDNVFIYKKLPKNNHREPSSNVLLKLKYTNYLANSTALVSRITVTLICPGYWSSSSI